MATIEKITALQSVAESGVRRMWENTDYYMSFLRMSGQLYKYSFKDKVLIHENRPNAVACAEFDTWTNSDINRYIRRGSKGIPLITDRNGRLDIRYVFDFTDTGARDERSKEPFFWKITENNENAVLSTLGTAANNIPDALIEKAHEIVSEQMDNYFGYFGDCIEDTFLEELDEFALQSEFQNLLEKSIAYSLLSRCGYNTDLYIDKEDFSTLYEFNGIGVMTVLGTAVSDLSEQVLRNIERTLKIERSKENERSISKNDNRNADERGEYGVHTGRENRDVPSAGAAPAAEANRKIRSDETEVPEGALQPNVSENGAGRNAEQPLVGDGRGGEAQSGADIAENAPESGNNRGAESTEPNGVDRTGEQHNSGSRGDSNNGADLQLNNGKAELDGSAFSMPENFIDIEPEIEEAGGDEPLQFTFFDTDETTDTDTEPVKVRAKSSKTALSPELELAITEDLLMWGTGVDQGKLGVFDFYTQKHPDIKEFGQFLKKKYGISGHSGYGDSIIEFADFDAKGAKYVFNQDGERSEIKLSWNKMAERTADLIKNNRYLSAEDIDKFVKSSIWHLKSEYPKEREIEILKRFGVDGSIKNPSASLSAEIFDLNTASVLRLPDKENAYLTNVEINASPALLERLFANGLTELEKSTGKLCYETDGGNWNRFYIPDVYGNKWSNIPAEVFLRSDERAVLNEINAKIADISLGRAEAENVQAVEITSEQSEITAENIISSVLDKLKTVEVSEENYYSEIDNILADMLFSDDFFENESIINDLLNDEEMKVKAFEPHLSDYVKPANDEIGNIEQKYHIDQIPDVGELHNFIIKDDNLGVGGDKAKFRANVEAIQLLQELESENRHATPEEQKILSKYVGWGGLAQAFDENNQEWSNEFLELYTLLSEDEYKSALASTTGAYYTSPTVISAIYDGLSKLGFKEGNVLEPAMGVGNFFGMLPEGMRNSKLYGVELDSISGRIAKELYPNADIQINGYENTAFPDNFFDVAVGNVPFGNYKLNEKRYNKLNLKIHDHFFAKSLDKVRAGGVIAFVTSKGTLDKENSAFRKYIAQRAELLGAIRLPNDAFKHNAGTEVTSDIIFLQKREKVLDIEPDWINIGQTADGVPVNKYFEQHPEMILGEMRQGVEYSLYGDPEATACVPIEGASLKEQLKAAVSNIEGSMQKIELDSSKAAAAKAFGKKEYNSIPAEADVRNFSFTVVDDKLYYRENSQMFLQEFPKETEERIKEMIAIRDCTRTLIDYQLNEYEDEYIAKQQQKLNGLYDNFVKKFGLLNSRENTRAFADDSSLPLLTSLEILDEEGNLQRKADMFTKRTIKPQKEITHVETSTEALAVSISEKAAVNIPFMEKLTGKTEEEIVQDLKGVIYLLPSSNSDNRNYVTADEYLSGNIRDKLEIAELAAKSDPRYALNVEALKQVMPKPLTATEIDVRLGATWIDKDIYQQFIYELLKTPYYMQRGIEVNFSKYTSEWQVKGKSIDSNNTLSNMTFGTSRKNAYSIIEDTLNLRASRVYDQVDDGKGGTKSVLNEKETTLAQEKQEAIKMAFKDWIFKEPNRREQLVNRYNELFNSTRPRVYDGNHLTLSGMSPEIKLRPHQLNAIAHTIYGGNTLLAHQVGAGKTFEMVASAMESKRLGMCSKSLIVVPNHLTEQMGAEFMRLYPSANILVATKKDFEAQNRRRLCSKIATGDYDAVIIGHSQLEKIPISQERQERYLKNQISDIAEGIKSLKRNRGDSFSIKRLEVTKKNLEAKLKKLTESKKRDDVVTFEELGIDKMYIDEAHNFKNLFLYTKMRNVAGIQQTEAQKSSDLYLKCQYLDELTDGKGTVFATGTPVSNSMTELYTMMRYLQADRLREMDMQNFDAWAANFGESVTAIELAPEGTGYRAKTRFSKFFNLPELMNVFKEAADIKTADELDLDVPTAHFHNVVVKPSETQKEMVQSLSERAAAVHNKSVSPTEDNMLKITTDGRKIGLDQRLIDPKLPDEPNSKVNTCVDNVFDIYTKTTDKKSAQLIFCDYSTPKNDGSFNLYDDIRSKLISKGVPKDEIAFIHEADTEIKKKELFAKVRSGTVRVLLGSTSKCGAGTNIQDKLTALHHLDCPWRPSDVEHTKRNKGQPIIRQMALFPYTIINSLVMRILETTKEEILWSSVLLVICSINGNLPNRFIYLF